MSAYFDGQVATVVVQNMGTNGWHDLPGHPAVEIQLREDGDFLAACPMRADVPTASYGYFVFDVPQPPCDTSGIWIVFGRSEPELLSETQLGQLTMVITANIESLSAEKPGRCAYEMARACE
ncbi:hypothetical protein CO683_34985 [Bradyrhizobium ottawaense]|uniref:hypothetical protein n=1 Tax=Bradyrhizobium ottawaense TaxID=931866 RepID=UPI000BE8682E|nr:hypothetical protein [Bradyrhizobium ottawaense]PDT64964.1 hypothetical protein CO683_34985 [Bradyrhizobium ottawaense]